MNEALTPGTRLGPYEIVALIGSGGMGTVYRAHDSRLARDVAIKTLSASAAADPETLRRFETEAKAAGTLDHPNLLVVYDVGHEGAVSYIVAELLDGETLRERLRRQGAMPERQVVECAQQIVRGLTAAHARGIVHRDLKPENLFLTRDRRLKILDFGVAKVLRRSPANTLASMVTENMTALGVIVGTVGYMAPEQAMGDSIDHRADIFALGAVMYEMASGAQPFQRNTPISTLTAILEDDPPELPSTVTAGLAQIIRRCLEKRAEDRFQTTHDLGLALDLLTTTTVVGAVSAVPRPSNTLSRRQVLTYGASSIALLASGAAAANVIGGDGRGNGPPSYRRLTFRRGLVRSARVAPDGETIFYGALWDGEQCRAHSVRIDSPESRPLDLPDANVLAISRSGNLALALGSHLDGVITYGTLATVPVAGGAPRQMVEGVKFADWSPDGSELAIVRRGDGGDRLEYPIGNVLVDPSSGKSTGIGFARVSPDGKRVAFIHYRTPGSLVGRVSIVDKNRTITPLSDEYLNIHGLAWRGDEIWYTAADDRPLFRGLCGVKPGGAPRTITRTPGNATLWDAMPDGRLVIAQTDDRAAMITQLPGESTDHDLSWLDASWVADISRDGRTLLFTETGQGGGAGSSTYLRTMDRSPAIRLGAGHGLALSPDARWAICTPTLTGGGVPSPHLDIVPTGAGEPRRLPGNGLNFLDARWLADGRRIVAQAVDSDNRSRLYMLDAEAGRPAAVTGEGVLAWAVAPDDSAIAVRGPDSAIRIYPMDGSAPRELPGVMSGALLVTWIADGILVVPPRNSGARLGDVHRVDVKTGKQSFWQNILPRDRAGIMALVGLRVTPDGRTRAYTWHRALSDLYVADGLV